RMKEAVTEELRKAFRPEFLNRIDEIIVFHALSEDHLRKIVEIQLVHLRKRLEDRHITITLTDATKDHLVRVGHDPAYRGGPIKRVRLKEVETPLARRMLAGEVRDGQSVTVDYDRSRDVLTFVSQ